MAFYCDKLGVGLYVACVAALGLVGGGEPDVVGLNLMTGASALKVKKLGADNGNNKDVGKFAKDADQQPSEEEKSEEWPEPDEEALKDLAYMAMLDRAQEQGLEPGGTGEEFVDNDSDGEQPPEEEKSSEQNAEINEGEQIQEDDDVWSDPDTEEQEQLDYMQLVEARLARPEPTALARSFVTRDQMNVILSFGTPDDLMAWQRVARDWYARLVPEALRTIRARVLPQSQAPMMQAVQRAHVVGTSMSVIDAMVQGHMDPVCRRDLEKIFPRAQADIAKFLEPGTPPTPWTPEAPSTISPMSVHSIRGSLYAPEEREHDAGLDGRKKYGFQALSTEAVPDNRELVNDSDPPTGTQPVQTTLFVPAWHETGREHANWLITPRAFLEVQCWPSRTALVLRRDAHVVKYVVGDDVDPTQVSVKRFHRFPIYRIGPGQDLFEWKVYNVNSFNGNREYTGEIWTCDGPRCRSKRY